MVRKCQGFMSPKSLARIRDLSVRIVRDSITVSELSELAEDRFGDMVKAVVDLERGVMAVGEGMHADEEAGLLDDGRVKPICGGSTSTLRNSAVRIGWSSTR
jgi:Protein of unknown function (DUF5674)